MGNGEIEKLKKKNSEFQNRITQQENNLKNLEYSISNERNQYQNTINNIQNQMNQQSIFYENSLSQMQSRYEALLKQQRDLLLRDRNINSKAEVSQNEMNKQLQEQLIKMQNEQKKLDEEREKRERQREQEYNQKIENQAKIQKNYFERLEKQRQNEEKLRREEMQKREQLENQRLQREEEFKKDVMNKMNSIQDYQNQIEQLKKEAEKAERESEKRHREQIEKMNKREKELEDMIKEEKDRAKREALEIERKQIEEMKRKEEEAEKDFNLHYDFLKKKEINEFISEFKNLENDFCMLEISKFDTKKQIVELIKKLNRTEQLELRVLNMIEVIAKYYSENDHNYDLKHLNILLLGPTGVGKSTLINSVLKLPKNKEAKTQTTDPCTMGEPEFFCSESIPFLRLADSRGIEKSNYGVEEVVNSTVNFVNNQLKTNDPDKFIHCIWYCATDTRFEEVEVESLKKLAALYDNSTLPIIFVYTRAIQQEFYLDMKKKVDNLDLKIDFVDVIAKEIKVENNPPIKPKNINKLKNISIERAKNAISSSCFTALKNNISDIVKNNLIKNKNKANQMLQCMIREKIESLKEGTDILYMIEQIQEIIIIIIKKYFSGPNTDEQDFTKEGNNHIKNFLTNFFDFSMNLYKNILDNLINEKVKECISKIISLKLKVIDKHKISNKIIKTEKECEKELKNLFFKSVKSKAELFCMKNSGKFITIPIKDYFEKFIENKYNTIFNKDENVQKIFQNEAKKKFNRLNNLINMENNGANTQ